MRPVVSQLVQQVSMLCRLLSGGSKRGRVWIESPCVQPGSVLHLMSFGSRAGGQIRYSLALSMLSLPFCSFESKMPHTQTCSYRYYRAEFGRTGPIIRPERVILLRHGESMGNVDEGVGHSGGLCWEPCVIGLPPSSVHPVPADVDVFSSISPV